MGGFKKVLGAAAPIVGTALGGPLGGAVGGAAAGLLSGAPQQAERDSSRARQLTNQSIGTAQRGAQGAVHQFGLNSPLRDAFRFGALQQMDPTNPFSRDLFGGFAPLLQQESGPQGVGTGFEAPEPKAKPRGRGGAADQIRKSGGEMRDRRRNLMDVVQKSGFF